MELLHLKYFRLVARYEHITRAAEELHIAQPALSKTISSLEKELNVKLFDRTGKFIRLNDYGRVFLHKVEQALDILEDVKTELKEMSGDVHGIVDIAAVCGMPLLPDLLATFRKQQPNVGFHLVQYSSNTLLPNTYDVSITTSLQRMKNSESIPLLNEEIYLAVPSDHRLAKRKSIRLIEAADEDFIALRPGKSLREMTDAFCKLAGFVPKIIFESDDPSTVRKFIKTGQGVAFVPSISWISILKTHVTMLHIEDPICERTIQLNWYSDRYMSEAVKSFRQFTIDYFAKLAANREKLGLQAVPSPGRKPFVAETPRAL